MPPDKKDNGFARGVEQGKTEATLQSVAATLDDLHQGMQRIWDAIDGLPCGQRGALIAGNRLWLRLQWALLIALLGGGGMAVVYLLR